MDILISNSSQFPIYKQISEQVKKGILLDQLKEGEKLPSIRNLASELQISVITVKGAYETLENEGLIESVHGKGFFVSTQNKELLMEKKLRLLEEKIIDIVDNSKQIGISKEELMERVSIFFDD